MAVRQLNDGRQQGPRDENEPCDPHKYISMTESVNRQLNHRERALLYRKTMSSSCMLQCPPQTHTHTHFTVLYLHTAAEPSAHRKDKFVRVCVRELTHWLVHSRGCYHRDSSDKYHSLPEPAPHEREASLTLQKKKREKKKKKTHTHTHIQLSRYSTTLQSGRQYLWNAHLGMLKKTLKLDQLEEYFT